LVFSTSTPLLISVARVLTFSVTTRAPTPTTSWSSPKA
jgi:hypothetical protein